MLVYLGLCCRIFGYLEAILAPSWLQVGHLGSILALSWALLGAGWAHLGSSQASLDASWVHLFSRMAPKWAPDPARTPPSIDFGALFERIWAPCLNVFGQKSHYRKPQLRQQRRNEEEAIA